MAESKPKKKKVVEPTKATLLEEALVKFRASDVETSVGVWVNPDVSIRYPKGTEFDIVEVKDNAYRVEIDFNDFALGFSLRKEAFKVK